MDILELSIQIVSLLATLVGLYLISEKNKLGFIFYVVSLLCQLYLFAESKYWFLVFQMVLLIILNIITYLKWKKGEK